MALGGWGVRDANDCQEWVREGALYKMARGGICVTASIRRDKSERRAIDQIVTSMSRQ